MDKFSAWSYVDVGLFRAIVQHGAGPAVRVKKEYHISIDASQGNQHIGQQIDGLVAVVTGAGYQVRNESHPDIAQ